MPGCGARRMWRRNDGREDVAVRRWRRRYVLPPDAERIGLSEAQRLSGVTLRSREPPRGARALSYCQPCSRLARSASPPSPPCGKPSVKRRPSENRSARCATKCFQWTLRSLPSRRLGALGDTGSAGKPSPQVNPERLRQELEVVVIACPERLSLRLLHRFTVFNHLLDRGRWWGGRGDLRTEPGAQPDRQRAPCTPQDAPGARRYRDRATQPRDDVVTSSSSRHALSSAVGRTTRGVAALSRGASSDEGTSENSAPVAIEAAREGARRQTTRPASSGSVATGLAMRSARSLPWHTAPRQRSAWRRPARRRRRRPVPLARVAPERTPERTPDTRRAVAPHASNGATDCSQRAV